MATTENGKMSAKGKLFVVMHCSKCTYGPKNGNTCLCDKETVDSCMASRGF